MRRFLTLLATLALTSVLAGCPGGDNANNTNTNGNRAQTNMNAAGGGLNRNGLVDTNANVPANLNGSSAPSNTAVVTNDNRNENTSGVRTTNANNSNGRP